MRYKLILGICMILIFNSLASAWCIWDIGTTCYEDEDNNVYTSHSKTQDMGFERREDGAYIKKKVQIESAGYFEEDNIIKTRGEVDNLLEAEMVNQGIVYSCNVTEDKKTSAKCLSVDGKFNVEVEVSKKENGKYPVWIEKINQSYVKGKSNKKDKTYRKDVTELDFWLLNSKDTLEIQLSNLKDKIHIGESSTTIQIQGNSSSIIFDDTYFESGSGDTNYDTQRLKSRGDDTAGGEYFAILQVNLTEIILPGKAILAGNWSANTSTEVGTNASLSWYIVNTTFEETTATYNNWGGDNYRFSVGLNSSTEIMFIAANDVSDNNFYNFTMDADLLQLLYEENDWGSMTTNMSIFTPAAGNTLYFKDKEDMGAWSMSIAYETANDPPVIANIDDIERDEEFAQFTLDLSANITDDLDADEDIEISYSLNESLFTLSIVNTTDVLTFTRIINQSGVVNVSLWFIDTLSESTFESFDLIINDINDPPWLTADIANVHIDEDGTDVDVISNANLKANFSDVEDNNDPSSITLVYENDTTYVDCSIDGSNNLECDALNANSTGTSFIIVEMNDSGNLNTSFSVEVIIDSTNDAPVTPAIYPAVYTANFSFNGVCNDSWDVEGDTIYYTFLFDQNSPPSTAVQNTTATTFQGDYANGTYYFMCEATDGISNSASSAITTYDVDNTTIWNYTVDYTASGTEGGNYDFYINITANNLSGFVADVENVYLEYNTNNYLMTEIAILGDNIYSFHKGGIAVPFGAASRSFLFNITSVSYNGIYAANDTQNYTQTISSVDIYDCDGVTNATSVMIYNFTLWDEFADDQLQNTTPINLSDKSIKMDMNYYGDNPNQYKNLSITAGNSSNLTICMNPAYITYNHTSIIDYGGPGYDRRQYYFNQDNFDNLTDHVRLYLLEIAKAPSAIVFTVKDSDGNVLENYIIDIEKYFVGTDNHTTIGMLKTNADGQDSIYLQQNEPFYKFIITNADTDNIVYTSADTKITSTAVTLTVGATTWGGTIYKFKETEYSLIFSNDTRTFTLNYAGLDSDVDKICLRVSQERRSGTVFQGETCGVDEIDTLTQSVSGMGVFTANVYQRIVSDNEERLDIPIDYPLTSLTQDDRLDFSSVIGNEGLVVAIFLILTISLVMIWSPSAAVAASLIGLTASFMFGLINIGVGSLIGLIIVGIFMIVRLKT